MKGKALLFTWLKRKHSRGSQAPPVRSHYLFLRNASKNPEVTVKAQFRVLYLVEMAVIEATLRSPLRGLRIICPFCYAKDGQGLKKSELDVVFLRPISADTALKRPHNASSIAHLFALSRQKFALKKLPFRHIAPEFFQPAVSITSKESKNPEVTVKAQLRVLYIWWRWR